MLGMVGYRQVATSQWSNLSSQESGSAGGGEVGVGVGAFCVPPGEARDDYSTLGDTLPLPSVGLKILS